MAFRRVLIAVDDSPIAAHAADVGIELARSLGAELAFVHAVDPALGYAPEGGIPPAQLIALAQQGARKLLKQVQLRAAGTPAALAFAVVGKPAAEIAQAARDWPADLLIVGSHGRGGVPRVLLGSVAEGVVRHAPCPVLVVRAPA